VTCVKLMCFGKLELEGCPSSRISPQQLLLLCHTLLEAPRSRREVAGLFWPHLAGAFTKKGERKDASNLSVARAILKSETGLDIHLPATLETLECDALRFRRAVQTGDLETAVALHRRGAFLHGIEHRSRLKLSEELYQWLVTQRGDFDEAARLALIELARAAMHQGQPERARQLAEEAQGIPQDEQRPEVLLRLHQLLLELNSPLAGHADTALRSSVADVQLRLSATAFRFYLLLSLQNPANLAATHHAAELSAKAGAAAAQELLEAHLTDPSGQVRREIAWHYLREHPAEKMRLLSLLRDHTPTAQAHAIYSQIFELGQTFGGVGYWERARTAYCLKARGLIESGAFEAAIAVLAEFEQAEHLNQQQPHPDNRFLHAYALERSRQARRGLDVLRDVPETPEVLAIKSALLLSEDYTAARHAAEAVLDGDQHSPDIAWARAIALNTLGLIAYHDKRPLEAELHFDQASVTWAVAGHPARELGAMMNRANVLEELRRFDDARSAYEDVLTKAGENDLLRVRALLNLGLMHEHQEQWTRAHTYYERARDLSQREDLASNDAALVASVFNNLGYTQWKLGWRDRARSSLNAAMELALRAGEKHTYAAALGNFALVERSVGKLEMAIDLLRQLGAQRHLDEYSRLYQGLLHTLLLEAQAAGRVDELALYTSKLATQTEQPAGAR
jgi:tetratricopeptide (TPR) repeat protein